MTGGIRGKPPVDEDAEHVLRVPMTGRNTKRIYHLPSRDDPDAPACGCERDDGEPWRRTTPDQLLGDWDVCSYCAGSASYSDGGVGVHESFAELSPEDLGLGPYPPENGDGGEA